MMGRRSYTERELVTIARASLVDALSAARVANVPPPMHALMVDTGGNSRLGGVYVGVEAGQMDPLDGRKNKATASEYPCQWQVQAVLVDAIPAQGLAEVYLDHLDDVRRVSGALASLWDDADPAERVPVQEVRHRTEWQLGTGRFIVTIVTADVLARAPLTVL